MMYDKIKINFKTLAYIDGEDSEENYEEVSLEEAVEFYCDEFDLINLGVCKSQEDLDKALEKIEEVADKGDYFREDYYVFDKFDNSVCEWYGAVDYFLEKIKE